MAYGIIDELLHIELFTALEIKKGGYTAVRDELNKNQDINKREFTTTVERGGLAAGRLTEEALPLYIRNAIHHPEELARDFNDQDLKDSVDIILELLQ